MKTLSNDADTGQPTINGQPATPEQVREVLQEAGYWWNGEYMAVVSSAHNEGIHLNEITHSNN